MKQLKRIRIFVSTVVAVLLTSGIAGGAAFAITDAEFLKRLQLFPALMSMQIATIAFWVAFTCLFGRVYCSSVCPLGTLQDAAGRLGRIAIRHSHYRYAPPRNHLRYTVLILTIASIIGGIAALPAILDPYTAYSRTIEAIVGRTALSATAGAGMATTASVIVAATATIVAFFRGRTFCNTLCPVGAALSLCSRRPRWHIDIDTDKCTDCRRCEDVCKARCINLSDHTADMSRCVLCFDCIDKCDDDAISYTPFQRGAATPLMQRIRNLLAPRQEAALDACSPAPDKKIKKQNITQLHNETISRPDPPRNGGRNNEKRPHRDGH